MRLRSRAPAAVLLRPEGYVAWATDEPTTADSAEALTTWVGATDLDFT
ncbi:hypothetical protein ACQPXH_27375 [Nocardia sp. CA-135953]